MMSRFTLIRKLLEITGIDMPFDSLPDDKKSILGKFEEELKREDSVEDKLSLVNRIFLILGIDPVSRDFFEKFLGEVKFSREDKVEKAINEIKSMFLLHFGDFSRGYMKMNRMKAEDLEHIKNLYYTSQKEKNRITRLYKEDRKISGFENIEVRNRPALGYLADKETPMLNIYRMVLKEVVMEGIKKDVKTFSELKNISKEIIEKNRAKLCGGEMQENNNGKNAKGEGNCITLEMLIKNAAVKNGTYLLSNKPGELFDAKKDYSQILGEVKRECEVDIKDPKKHINEQRQKGIQNTYAYLTTQDIDVYFATSMRTAEDFVVNASFVENVVNILKKEYNFHIIYFDPTQSYLPDRIQKGLVESIMISRSKIVVYDAQERETFGKDAEAGIGLSHRKPVIIYVPRLFIKELKKFYEIFDEYTGELDKLLDRLEVEGFIENRGSCDVKDNIQKIDILDRCLQRSPKIKEILSLVSDNELKGELMKKGYYQGGYEDNIKNYAMRKVITFEKRAILFKELHPLSFQVSPVDGVARGVFVTRSEEQTAELIKKLILKDLEYQIIETDYNYLLIDELTKSPLRVLPKDKSLRIALYTHR